LEEFGHTKLGNTARTRRLLLMAERAANKPSGKITEIFKTVAEREGAYKFLENKKIDELKIAQAAHSACVERCKEEDFVFVPVDQSTLSFKDPQNIRGVGPVGSHQKKGTGLEVMSAIAVKPDGTPVGVCGQTYWVRPPKKTPKVSKAKQQLRPFEEKETRYWLETIEQTQKAFQEAGSTCVPWYQLDRGGDFKEMLLWAENSNSRVTVRASKNRCVKHEETKYLRETLEAQKPLGTYKLEILKGPNRQARMATMEIRGREIEFKLEDRLKKQKMPCKLHAILVREVNTTPATEKPIEWLLITNYTVKTFKDARLVVFGYTQRWRIEEFHKTWKSTCRIEDSQLRDVRRIGLLAIILSSVAMRIERLKYLARNEPKLPATVEFTRHEIDAIIIQRKPKSYKPGMTPTIALAVRWAADLGGYIGKSSGGPPGAIVIGRGLRELKGAVHVLEYMKENKK